MDRVSSRRRGLCVDVQGINALPQNGGGRPSSSSSLQGGVGESSNAPGGARKSHRGSNRDGHSATTMGTMDDSGGNQFSYGDLGSQCISPVSKTQIFWPFHLFGAGGKPAPASGGGLHPPNGGQGGGHGKGKSSASGGAKGMWAKLKVHVRSGGYKYAYLWRRREGFLLKQGSGSTRKWNRRWFVLDKDRLAYFTNLHESDPESCKGVIELPLVQKVMDAAAQRGERRAPKKSGNTHEDHGFLLVTAKRTYHFVAMSSGDKKEWIKAIQSAIDAPFIHAITSSQ
jgi:hypothetical protein